NVKFNMLSLLELSLIFLLKKDFYQNLCKTLLAGMKAYTVLMKLLLYQLLTFMARLDLQAMVILINKNQVSRSEEHTSELQSRFDIVCRPRLDKKKKKNKK